MATTHCAVTADLNRHLEREQRADRKEAAMEHYREEALRWYEDSPQELIEAFWQRWNGKKGERELSLAIWGAIYGVPLTDEQRENLKDVLLEAVGPDIEAKAKELAQQAKDFVDDLRCDD